MRGLPPFHHLLDHFSQVILLGFSLPLVINTKIDRRRFFVQVGIK
jgi:hypothetical protein